MVNRRSVWFLSTRYGSVPIRSGLVWSGLGPPAQNTGRWTYDEHRLFLRGLELHGKGWKKIASLIRTRTVVQIRTHAQKYFQKVAKAKQNGGIGGEHGEGSVDPQGKGSRKKSRGYAQPEETLVCEIYFCVVAPFPANKNAHQGRVTSTGLSLVVFSLFAVVVHSFRQHAQNVYVKRGNSATPCR